MSSDQNTNKEKKKVFIYQPKARNNSNQVSLKSLGWIYDDEKVIDEPLDLDNSSVKTNNYLALFGDYLPSFIRIEFH